MIIRAVQWAGVIAFALIALVLAPGLLHPSEVYAPGGNRCAGHRAADAVTYAVGAAVVFAAALCAASLARRLAPTWLAIVGLATLLLGALTSETRVFGCLNETASRPVGHFRLLAFGLAMIAVALVGVAYWRMTRRGARER